MKQAQIDALLKSYNLSQEELDSRVVLQEFVHSISAIVVDEFAKHYLLNNPELSIYLAHTDANRLLKNIKEFVAFVLVSPVNEAYVKRIHYIGSIHYSIKLEPAKVSYGFWAIGEVLNKLATVNELVQEHKSLITKILRFVEHLMNDGYYRQKEKQYEDSIEQLRGFNAQNELYLAFQLHKQNVKKIDSSFEFNNTSILEGIQDSPHKCGFGEVLDTLKSNKKYEYIMDGEIEDIIGLHNNWHDAFVKYKHAHKNKNRDEMKAHKNEMALITTTLKDRLHDTLQSSLSDGRMALNSGIKSMRNITDLFRKIEIHSDFETMFNDTFEETFREFSWAIEDIYINFEVEADESYKIRKQLRHEAKNIYLGLKLKKSQDSHYIYEMLTILVEILDLHFSAKEREVALISFADKAENANKAKDMFLANMSHELRTPLNAIMGFSQIVMMKKEIPDNVKKYVKKINIAGNNLLDLVNTILDFAKLESGKMQFTPRLSNISNVLDEVSILVSPLALNKNISLQMPNIISLSLYIDDKLFKQVLVNLLTNAIKFTANDRNVSLSIVYDATKRMYQFEVKDDGVGLSEEAIKGLFQAFSQVDNIYQKTEQGTGLGLMISKKIIEDLHKGKIWVESVEGRGSSFLITMPTPRIESHTYEINEAPKGSRKALVVDDSPAYQKILAEHLKDNISLTFTDTVNKAKHLIVENSYDFLILDFFLTDGISSEILEYMEDEGIEIPTIVVSAEDAIQISSSLSGSSNLEGIIDKNNIDNICASLKGESFNG